VEVKMHDIEMCREMMIRRDLAGRGIMDPKVLEAMRSVPREEFIPPALRDQAYEDYPLPIADGQTISQPYIVAFMIEALELSPGDRVLEIGTGSGYSAAVLSRIVSRVYTVERISSLAETARERLLRLGYGNIAVYVGDGTLGWPEHAPYDGIVVTAGAPRVPNSLLGEMAEGGRLVIPVGPDGFGQTLLRMRRLEGDEFLKERLLAVQFVPLIGAEGW
jgi:protein-L-isoaspartate(D-aspartate) O-methyltransferase